MGRMSYWKCFNMYLRPYKSRMYLELGYPFPILTTPNLDTTCTYYSTSLCLFKSCLKKKKNQLNNPAQIFLHETVAIHSHTDISFGRGRFLYNLQTFFFCLKHVSLIYSKILCFLKSREAILQTFVSPQCPSYLPQSSTLVPVVWQMVDK